VELLLGGGVGRAGGCRVHGVGRPDRLGRLAVYQAGALADVARLGAQGFWDPAGFRVLGQGLKLLHRRLLSQLGVLDYLVS